MYKGAILNIQKNSKKASSCPDIYNNNSTLTISSEAVSVSAFLVVWGFFTFTLFQTRTTAECKTEIYYMILRKTKKKYPVHTFLQMSHRDSIVKVINQLSNKRVNTVRRVRRKRSYFHPKTLKKVRQDSGDDDTAD